MHRHQGGSRVLRFFLGNIADVSCSWTPNSPLAIGQDRHQYQGSRDEDGRPGTDADAKE